MLENLSLIKSWIKKEKVLDVILFGSLTRGKIKPADIDLCILVCDKDEKRSLDLVDSLSKITDRLGGQFQINILTTSQFVQGNSLAKTLLLEGISIKTTKKFSVSFGFEGKSAFVYTLSHFSATQRVRFHYALKGRYGSEGMLRQVEGEFWNSGTIVVPILKEDILKEFFITWNVKFSVKKFLIG